MGISESHSTAAQMCFRSSKQRTQKDRQSHLYIWPRLYPSKAAGRAPPTQHVQQKSCLRIGSDLRLFDEGFTPWWRRGENASCCVSGPGRHFPLQWLLLSQHWGLCIQTLRPTTSLCNLSKCSHREARSGKSGVSESLLCDWQTLEHVQVLMRGKCENTVPRRHKNQQAHHLNAWPQKAKWNLHRHIPQRPTQAVLRHPAFFTPECFFGSNTKPLCSNIFRGRSGICCQSTTLAASLSRNNDGHVFLKSALPIFSDKNWSTAERILAAIKPEALEFPLKLYCSLYYFI